VGNPSSVKGLRDHWTKTPLTCEKGGSGWEVIGDRVYRGKWTGWFPHRTKKIDVGGKGWHKGGGIPFTATLGGKNDTKVKGDLGEGSRGKARKVRVPGENPLRGGLIGNKKERKM